MEVPSHIVAPAGIELRRSEVDTSQMGAWCVTPIAKGTIFGPFVGEIVYKHKDKNIDYRFAWEVFDLEKNELSHIINATDPMKGNWMRYVNCARFLEEQNIVSVQDNGQVFYKAIQNVDPEKELLTWFQPFKKRRRRRKNTSVDDKTQDATVSVKTTSKSQSKVKPPTKAKSVDMETETSTTKSSSSKIMMEATSTESATAASAMAATGPESVTTNTSTGNYIDSPIEILDTKRQRKKKKLFDEEILLTDLVFKKKRRRRSKEEIERDAIEAALNAQTKGKRKRGRKKKSDMMINEEIVVERREDDDEHGGREDSPMKASPVLENLEEVEGNTVDSLEKSWTYPDKHLEYQFSLHPHFGITQNGRRVYRCDVCAGVYKHTFSLKRHYLRNHINCRYLSRADITNCMILIGQQQLAILKSNKKDLLQKIDETLSRTANEDGSKERSETKSEGVNQEATETGSEDKIEADTESSKVADSALNSLTDSAEQNSPNHQDEQASETSEEVKIKNATEELPEDEIQTSLPSMAGLYKCNICYKLFDEIEALKLHTQDHPKVLDVKGFSCDRCHMRFTYKQNLVRHQIVHEGETDPAAKSLPTTPVKAKPKLGEKKVPVIGKPFKCPRCPMKFKYTTNLERHEALHFADRSFICSYCGKGFPSATNMKKHEHIHLGSRVPCKYCTAVFVHVGSLRKHIRLEHPDIHRQRLLKLLEKRGKLGTKAARTLQESYNKDATSTFQKKLPGSSQIVQRMKIIKEGKVPVRDESDSKFKFSCLICKKRFSAYVNMCRHRRLAHKDSSEIPRICQSESTLTEGSVPSPVKPKRQLSRLRILMGSPKRDEEPIVFETANDPIDDSPEANVNFYANVAANIAENLTSYIDGGEASMAKFKQHIRIKDYDSVFTTVKEEKFEGLENSDVKDEFQWEKFNFPQNYDPKVISENFVDLTELAPLNKENTLEQVEDDTSYKNKAPALCTRRRTSREGFSSTESSRDGLESSHFRQKDEKHEIKMEIKTEIKDKKDDGDNTTCDRKSKKDDGDNTTCDRKSKKDDKSDETENNTDEKEKSFTTGEVTKAVLKLPLVMSLKPTTIKSEQGSETHNKDSCDKSEFEEHFEEKNCKNNIEDIELVKSDCLDSDSGSSESLPKSESAPTKQKNGNDNSIIGDNVNLCNTDKTITDSVSVDSVKNKKKEKISSESISVVQEQRNSDVNSDDLEKLNDKENDLETERKTDERHENNLENDEGCSVTEDIRKSTESCKAEVIDKEKCNDSVELNKDSNQGLLISNVVGETDVTELWCHETLSNSSPDNLDNNTVDINRSNNNTDAVCQSEEGGNSGYSSPGVYNPPLSPDSESDLDFSNYGAVSPAQLIQGLNLAKARQNWQENNNIGTQDDRMISAERIYRSLLKLKEDPYQSEQQSPLHNFDSIAFGNFGKRAYVCSVCMRHFPDNEAVLRHQWKKHPLVACHTLEIEDGHDIEYLYYTQPTNVGILGACGKALENVLDRNTYTCTRCNGTFKNIDRLHIHIMNCAPKSVTESNIQEKLPRKRKRKFPKKFIGMDFESKDTEQQERDKLEELSRNYIAKLKAQKKIFLGCRKRKIPDLPLNENPNDTKMRRRRSYEIGYNPGNHVRRREMTELLDTHQCKGCGVKFKSISLLERHVRKCDGKEKFKDLKVMKSTVNESFHKKHKQICLYCQRGFAYPKTLMNHYRAFCVVKKDKLMKGTLSEAERVTEAEMIVRLKQQDEDRNEAVSVHHMEEVEGHRKGWPKGLKRKSRRKNHCWTYIKKRKSSNDAPDNDDDELSETASQMSSDSPSKCSDSSLISESMSSQKSLESLKLSDFPDKTTKISGSSQEHQETSASTACERNPVLIKTEPLDSFDAVKPGNSVEETKLEQKYSGSQCTSQNMDEIAKEVSEDLSANGGNRTKSAQVDGGQIGQDTSECILVKYNVDTVSPATDRHMLTLKPVVLEGPSSQTKCHGGEGSPKVSPGSDLGSTTNKSVNKSPKKVKKNKSEQEKVSSLSMLKTESVIPSLTSSLPTLSSQKKIDSEFSSVNVLSSHQTTLLAVDEKVPNVTAIPKSPAKKMGKKMIAKQDSAVSQKQNSKDLSLNEEKSKKSPNKSKGMGSSTKLLPTKVEKRSPVVLNCPDLSKMVGKGDLPKKTNPRKSKKSESLKEIKKTLSNQIQSPASSLVSIQSEIHKEPNDLVQNSESLQIPYKNESVSQPRTISSTPSTKPKPPSQQNQGMLPTSTNLSNGLPQKIISGLPRTNDTAKSELIRNEPPRKFCGAELLAKCDNVSTKMEEDVNKSYTKPQQVIVRLGSEQFCVALPNPAISSVLNSTSKTNKQMIAKTGVESVGNKESRETTLPSEDEKKEKCTKISNQIKRTGNTPVCPQKTTPKMSKVLMDSGKISNVRWPVKKSQMPQEEGLPKGNLPGAVTSTHVGNVTSHCGEGKEQNLNFTQKAIADQSKKSNNMDTFEKSLKKQQKQQKPKQKQQSENVSQESRETVNSLNEEQTGTGLLAGNGHISCEIPNKLSTISQSVNMLVGGNCGKSAEETSTKKTLPVSKAQGLNPQNTSLSGSATNLSQIQLDKTAKSPRKRRKTAPKLNVSVPELKDTKCVQNSARISLSPDRMSHAQVSKLNTSTDKVSTDNATVVTMSVDMVSNDKKSKVDMPKVELPVNKLNGSFEEFDQLAPMNNLLQLACIATDVLKGVVASSDEEERSSVHKSKTSPFHSESAMECSTPQSFSSDMTPKLVVPDSTCVQQKMSNHASSSHTPKTQSPSLSVKAINSTETPTKLDICGSNTGLCVFPMSANPVKPSPRKKRVSRSPMKLATREELLNKCGLSPHTDMFTNTVFVKGDKSAT